MKPFAILLLLASINCSFGQNAKSHINQKKGVAINGYDLVSYFQNSPLKGIKQFNTVYKGVTYYFSSADNQSQFLEAPERYIPQYGGWCAYAMGISGDKVKINPETFKIKDDKLFLFYDFQGNNTLDLWNKDESNLLPAADNYWSELAN